MERARKNVIAKSTARAILAACRRARAKATEDPEDTRADPYVVDKEFSRALGGHQGLNADFVNKAWLLSAESKERSSYGGNIPSNGQIYLFDDDEDRYIIGRVTFDDDGVMDVDELAAGRVGDKSFDRAVARLARGR